MKKIIIAIVLVLSVFSINSFASCNLYYIAGNLGLTSLYDMDVETDIAASANGQLSFDSAFNFGWAFGVIKRNLRFEVELRYQQGYLNKYNADGGIVKEKDELEFSMSSLFGNIYYDFDIGFNLAPYVGGGIGVAKATFDDFTTKSSGHNISPGEDENALLAWQLGLGVAYILDDSLMLDLAYRYISANGDTEIGSNNFMLGVRYVF